MGFVRSAVAGAGAMALSAALACGPSGEVTRGTGSGTVVSIDAAHGKVVLEHGQVPGVMGAMKMSFQVANPRLLEGIEPGERVEFEIEHAGGQYLVTEIHPQRD
jgi:Cu/Ag efflux protein CusF